MTTVQNAGSSAKDRSQWSVVWPAPAVVALGLAAAALPFGVYGFEVAWVLVVLLVLALLVSPWLAYSEVRRLRCTGPRRLTLDAGHRRIVALDCAGRARDTLVRIGARERLARAPWAAIARGGGDVATALTELRINRRGRLPTLALELASTFPFGLCEVREQRTLGCETIVRPRPLAPGPWLRAALAPEVAESRGATRDPAGEFRALVEWRPGESLRRLHAGATLRRGRPVRIEATSAGAGMVTVVLATASGANAAAFERSVSAAARIVLVLERSGRRLTLHVQGSRERGAVEHPAAVARPFAQLIDALPQKARGTNPTLVVVGVPAADGEEPPSAAAPGVVVVACEATGAPRIIGRGRVRTVAAASSRATSRAARRYDGARRR
jgi:uncharacterized protein (DUF58 family)